MNARSRSLIVVVLAGLLWMPVARAEVGEGYREYQFGGTVAAVSALAHVPVSDTRTLHARPALLQELSWRRPYSPRDPVDPVQAMVFSFYNDQLFKVVVDYDADQTLGLTSADMILALSNIYGPISAASPKTSRPIIERGEETGLEVARWGGANQSVVLQRVSYPPFYRLAVTSLSTEALARAADVEARRLDVKEAPQRELDRQKQVADAARAAEEKARAENKATFRP